VVHSLGRSLGQCHCIHDDGSRFGRMIMSVYRLTGWQAAARARLGCEQSDWNCCEIGRQELRSAGSNVDFFSRAETKACFCDEGKLPACILLTKKLTVILPFRGGWKAESKYRHCSKAAVRTYSGISQWLS